MAEKKSIWPGDLLVTFKAGLVTHEMLEITPAQQKSLVAQKRRGGAEGREAEIILETCRIAMIKWLGECDLEEELEALPPATSNDGTSNWGGANGVAGKMRPTGRMRSRWIGDDIRAPSGPQYGDWKDGRPDDYFRLITDNFDDFFQSVELFNPGVMMRSAMAKKALNLSSMGVTPEEHIELLKMEPRYEENTRWFQKNLLKCRSEAMRKLADVPKRERVEPKVAMAMAVADDEDVEVSKPRGRPKGSKDKAKRAEPGGKRLRDYKEKVEARRRELQAKGVIQQATGVIEADEEEPDTDDVTAGDTEDSEEENE